MAELLLTNTTTGVTDVWTDYNVLVDPVYFWLTGLEPETTYEAQVIYYKSDGTTTDPTWQTPVHTFTTEPDLQVSKFEPDVDGTHVTFLTQFDKWTEIEKVTWYWNDGDFTQSTSTTRDPDSNGVLDREVIMRPGTYTIWVEVESFYTNIAFLPPVTEVYPHDLVIE
jgi:hypothetical protein